MRKHFLGCRIDQRFGFALAARAPFSGNQKFKFFWIHGCLSSVGKDRMAGWSGREFAVRNVSEADGGIADIAGTRKY